MKKRVADIIIETLINNNITDAFCVVGGGAMFLNNAAGINPDMHIIFNHHEQACAMACEGYARTKNKMALCLVTSGPGGTNTLTGVMGAYQDSIPMIVISGQVRYTTTVQESGLKIRRRGEQEFDIVNSVQNMKWNFVLEVFKAIKNLCDLSMQMYQPQIVTDFKCEELSDVFDTIEEESQDIPLEYRDKLLNYIPILKEQIDMICDNCE